MKLGLGLSPQQLDLEHYRFARQCGCTHLLLHLAADASLSPRGVRESSAAGYVGPKGSVSREDPWTYDVLARLTEQANAADLQIEAVDNRDPALSLDSLLGSANRARPMEKLKRIIRNVGKVGIPLFVYHLSLSTAKHESGRFARGDAEAARLVRPQMGTQPDGRRSFASARNRLTACLDELVAVAEGAGVTLAAPPDEPLPLKSPAATPNRDGGDGGEELMGLHPGSRHQLMFRVAETAAAGGDPYAALETGCRAERVACVQFGNVSAGSGAFHEAFVDDGDLDMRRIVRILQEGRFGGLIIPGRLPRMSCSAPWHAGVAHTLGYLKAALSLSPSLL